MTPDEFRKYYSRLPVSLLLVSVQGVIEGATAHAADLLECSQDELTGRALFDFGPADPARLRRYLRTCSGSSEYLPGVMTLHWGEQTADLHLHGASAGQGTGRVLLQLASRAETHRRFLSLNEKIERLAIEVEDRRRTESLTAGQNEVLGMIARDAPIREVLHQLVTILESYAGPEVKASVLLADDDGNLRLGAAPGLSPEFLQATATVPVARNSGSCGTAAWLRQAVAVRDIATDPLWAGYRDVALRAGLRACWSMPIQAADGSVLGTVAMYHGAPRLPTARDWNVAGIVARTAGIAIERHRATERLQQILSRQSVMLDGLPACIALIDGAGRIRSVNLAWHNWLREAALPEPGLRPSGDFLEICDSVLQCGGAAVSRMVREVAEGTRGGIDEECSYVPASGLRWIRLTVAPVPGPRSGSDDVILMHVDVTDRKRAENALLSQAEELMRINSELQQFAYVASHDLREPLRTIKSFSQLFVRRYRGQLSSEADEYLMYISEGVTRMEDLIQDLLAYSRVAHGTESAREQVDLAMVLERVRRSLHATIEETGTQITASALPVIHGHKTQLTQLLQNLIGNAIKYRSDAPPHIHVSAEPAESGWRISVSDNGAGIAPEYHESIFGLFKRLHSRNVPGTGIGLALCRKIAELHGGSISVESKPGEGSTFHVTLAG